ncbi:MAG TPA: hypothetical protein ENI87_05985 [bacterium]|nr:hypothetical protein [bacterium]
MSTLAVTSESLQGMVTNALERMAFVFAEESALTVGEVLAQAAAHAEVELRGEQNLAVTVSATAGLVQEIASSMMGCEPDEIDVDDHGVATVSELANVFGGELVVQFGEQDQELSIGLPCELTDEDAGGRIDRATAAGLTCIVASDDGALLVTVAARD